MLRPKERNEVTQKKEQHLQRLEERESMTPWRNCKYSGVCYSFGALTTILGSRSGKVLLIPLRRKLKIRDRGYRRDG